MFDTIATVETPVCELAAGAATGPEVLVRTLGIGPHVGTVHVAAAAGTMSLVFRAGNRAFAVDLGEQIRATAAAIEAWLAVEEIETARRTAPAIEDDGFVTVHPATRAWEPRYTTGTVEVR